MTSAKSKRKYGPKMADPRFVLSKEDRQCGPLGHYVRWKQGEFTSMKPWTPGASKIPPSLKIRRKRRLQRTRKEVFAYFGLKDENIPE